MKRRVVHVEAITRRRFEREDSVVVTFDDRVITEWCLNLFLLREGLLERISLAGQDEVAVEVLNGRQVAKQERAQARWTRNCLELHVSPTELQYWIRFFGKYYLEGVADVDHIDVETQPAKGSRSTSLTLKVLRAVAPVSAEEARRRLGSV